MRISDWSSDVCSSDLGDEVFGIGLLIRLVFHLLDVGAGGKGLLGTGKEDAADAIVAFEIVQRCLEIGDQRLAKRVQRLRPVQRDDADAGFLLDDDVLVAHDISFSVRSEEHTSELQSLMRNSYAVFCLKKKKQTKHT